MISLNRGVQGKLPCNICLVEQGDLLLPGPFPMRTQKHQETIFEEAKILGTQQSATAADAFCMRMGYRYIPVCALCILYFIWLILTLILENEWNSIPQSFTCRSLSCYGT